MVVHAEDVPSILESLPEPSTPRQTDPLETSLVESGPQLVRSKICWRSRSKVCWRQTPEAICWREGT